VAWGGVGTWGPVLAGDPARNDRTGRPRQECVHEARA